MTYRWNFLSRAARLAARSPAALLSAVPRARSEGIAAEALLATADRRDATAISANSRELAAEAQALARSDSRRPRASCRRRAAHRPRESATMIALRSGIAISRPRIPGTTVRPMSRKNMSGSSKFCLPVPSDGRLSWPVRRATSRGSWRRASGHLTATDISAVAVERARAAMQGSAEC